MTALDVFLLLLVGGLGLIGLQKGFVAEAVSIIAWVAGVAAVRAFHDSFTTVLTDRVGAESGAAVLAFAIIFGGSYLLGRILSGQLGDIAKGSGIGFLDRLLGFGFGALKGLIAATLLYTMLILAYDMVYTGGTGRPGWVEKARSYQFMNACSSALTKFIADRREAGKRAPEN